MKNNKTPGIDDIPEDLLKAFWLQLKYFVRISPDYCFRKSKLSCSLRQAFIIGLPKDAKDRQF